MSLLKDNKERKGLIPQETKNFDLRKDVMNFCIGKIQDENEYEKAGALKDLKRILNGAT